MTDIPLQTEYVGVATIAQFIDYAKKHGPGASAVASKGRVSKSTYYDVLKSAGTSRVDTLAAFCDALGVDLVVAVRKK
jgi:DNA-binding phage protein